MDAQQLEELQSKNPENIKSILSKFNDTNAALFDFADFHSSGQWLAIWQATFQQLQDSQMVSAHTVCLNTIRILTRDDASLQSNDIIDDFTCLLKLAQLEAEGSIAVGTAALTTASSDASTIAIIIEALKCLCNIVYQSTECRRNCIKMGCTERTLRRVSSGVSASQEIDLFDLKLLFLLTALEPTARTRVQIDLNGQVYLTHLLDEKLQGGSSNAKEIDLICELLKVLFNITSSADDSRNENEIQDRHLCSVLRRLLLKFGQLKSDVDKQHSALTHAVNLLTNIASPCLSELLLKCDANVVTTEQQLVVYEGFNVRVLEILMSYMRWVLSEQQTNTELIPPILTVLVKCVKCKPTMRHYVRAQLLPPLRDVSERPEVGNELRNHLCRFLTLPDMVLRDLSAELLFVCCKENVGRMIKYTGYGNAAGLFASRGLLDGRTVPNSAYSSDSEDSDTEEYKRVQYAVNPVLGCKETESKRSPFEGMSEEQMEYEAMQLVEIMNKLHSTGIVKPCRIGEDGTPQPLEHILQLQEELPQQQLEQKRKC